MTDEEMKKIGGVVKDAVRPIKELVEILKSKVGQQDLYLRSTSHNVKYAREQQSVINEKLDKVQKTVGGLDKKVTNLDKKVSGLDKTIDGMQVAVNKLDKAVDGHTGKLNALWDQAVKLTLEITEIKDIVISNQANVNIKKVDKRLTRVEDQLGIVSPPELTIAHQIKK